MCSFTGCTFVFVCKPTSSAARLIKPEATLLIDTLQTQLETSGSSHTQEVMGAAEKLLEGFPHLLAAKGVDDGVDDGVAHDEDEVHVEVRHEAGAVRVPGAGDHEDEVEEERRPAHHEHPEEDGEGDGALHVGALVDGRVARQRRDALHVQARQQEHVDVQRRHEHQHGEEHGDEADEHRGAFGVDDEEDAGDGAARPDAADDQHRSPQGHDVVVAQCIEDGDVAVDGDGQQAADGRQEGAADHRVKHVVHAFDQGDRDGQVAAVDESYHNGLRGVGNADEHVSDGQAADEEVHGRVKVLVFDYSSDDQDVLQQADDAQSEEDLCGDQQLFITSS